MPDPVRDPATESNDFVTEFSASSKTDLLLGTLDVENGKDYNAAVLISGATQEMQVYWKVHLVPFGEYVPLRRSFPLFAAVAKEWVPGDFAAGKRYTLFHLTNGNAQIAPLICFEDTIGDLTRQFVIRGANLLVNVTNDAWFLYSAGSQQHLMNAIFRCVETRRPMVRAANTGVTCFVNQFGRVTQVLRDETGSTFTEGVLTGEIKVPTERELTFYAQTWRVVRKGVRCNHGARNFDNLRHFADGSGCRGVRRGERLLSPVLDRAPYDASREVLPRGRRTACALNSRLIIWANFG